MHSKKLALLFITYLWSHAILANSDIITITCLPPPSSDSTQWTRTPLTNSWAKYEYSYIANVDLPALNNQLPMTGDSNAETVDYFYGATWTDETFLCLYNYQSPDPIVMYESQLSSYVRRCYFDKPGQSDCRNADPAKCAITCELN